MVEDELSDIRFFSLVQPSSALPTEKAILPSYKLTKQNQIVSVLDELGPNNLQQRRGRLGEMPSSCKEIRKSKHRFFYIGK